ncbi:MAG: hypothetical protein H7Y27_04655, partial [Gemmatimonadaceae bacterium]|nr:hypothetical protein [Chitinophagaceae bacterium]
FRLSFFVNDINGLKELPDGLLNQKIANIAEHHKKGWSNHAGVMKMDADPSISAKINHGYVAGGDYLTFKASADIQNYKNYFVPSISLGVGLTISSHGYFKREFTLAWEPNFFFSRDPQGKLQTFRNDFLTLTAGHGSIKDKDPRKESHLLAHFSFSYLIYRQGEYFDKHAMRLGAGRLSLFNGKTHVEPVIYFNDLFRRVTPGLRWIQSF